MSFFNRALSGLFLASVTLALISLAVISILSGMRARGGEGGMAPVANERVFSAEVIAVQPMQIAPELTAFGEVQPLRALELRAPIGGAIVELSPAFIEGGVVAEGDVLLRIDPAEAQSAFDAAAADLAEAEAQQELRERALERQRDLAARGSASPASVETAEIAAATAAQATVSRRRALADAERRLADTRIRAPFAGVLSGVDLVEGRLVTANEQLATLIDPAALEVAFRLSTAQYLRLTGAEGVLPDLEVELRLELFDLSIIRQARLTRESGAVGAGQTGRLLFAEILDARGLRAGDFVTVHLTEPPLADVFVAPATAVGGDGMVLALGPDNRLEALSATILRRQGDAVILATEGLVGREIVANRSPALGAGIAVSPLRRGDGGDLAAPEPEVVELDPARRAELIAMVEGNANMPAQIKARLIEQLNQPQVPAEVIARLESRRGG